MSNRDGIREKLNKRRLLDSEITISLLENPHCLDEDPQKEQAYRIAIEHFIGKQKDCTTFKKDEGSEYVSVKLDNMIKCYQDAEDDSKKMEYAKEIALHVDRIPENLFKLIPIATRNVAFQIIIKYLENLLCS